MELSSTIVRYIDQY